MDINRFTEKAQQALSECRSGRLVVIEYFCGPPFFC